jgi:hypothetical protein
MALGIPVIDEYRAGSGPLRFRELLTGLGGRNP